MKLLSWFRVQTYFGCTMRSAHMKNIVSHRALFVALCLLGVGVLQMLCNSGCDISLLYLGCG